MEEPAKLGVKIADFGGAISDADPRDLPRNQFQRLHNIALERLGDAQSRRGLTFRQASPFTSNVTATKRTHAAFTSAVWNRLIFDVGNGSFRVIDVTGASTNNTTFTPSPAWHSEPKMRFAKTSAGEIIVTNGIDRPWKYNNQEGTAINGEGPACPLGIDPPTAAPSATMSSSGGAEAGAYLLAYRFVDRYGNPSVLSPTLEATATAGQKFSWTIAASSGLDSSGRVVKRQLFRTLVDTADVFYLVAEIGDNSTTTFDDTLSDDDLGERAALPLNNADGTLNANRFVVPPSHMQVSVWNEDRLFFLVNGRYSTGTITSSSTNATGNITGATNTSPIIITAAGHGLLSGEKVTVASVGGTTAANATWTIEALDRNRFALYGSTGNGAYTSGGTWSLDDSDTITGTGTAFTDEMIGWEVWPSATAKIPYRVVQVVSGTVLRVSPAVSDAFTDATYILRPHRAERNKVYFSEPEEPESVPQSQNEVFIQYNDFDGDDEPTGGASITGSLLVFKPRSTYAVDYARQGKVAASARLFAERGSFSQQCIEPANGAVYAMDRYGMWSTTDFDVGAPFDNYFRNGLVDFSKSDVFFVRANRRTKTVRFFVVLAGDSATYPNFCFCYNYALKRWSTEGRPWQITGAGNFTENGRDTYYELPYGGYPIVYDDGYSSDGITAGVRGTVSTYSTGTLTASASIFTSAMIGFPVVLTDGAAKAQTGVITAYTSGTVVTVSGLTTSPTPGDRFAIGGVPWLVLTPQYDVPAVSDRNKIQAVVSYAPTTNDGNSFDIRHYLDYRTDPENSAINKPEEGEFAELVAGSPDVVVNMFVTKNGGQHSGTARKELSGDTYGSLPTQRLLTIECRGVAVEERIRIPQIDVDGVR